MIGFLRKDLAVGMLGTIYLRTKQAVVGASVLAMFFPCIASVFALKRTRLVSSAGIHGHHTLSIGVGGLLNLLL